MLRTVSDQTTLWESVIPECLMGLPRDLAEIDVELPPVQRAGQLGRSR